MDFDTKDVVIATAAGIGVVAGGAAILMSASNSSKIKAVSAVANDAAQRVDNMGKIVAAHAGTIGLSNEEVAYLQAW